MHAPAQFTLICQQVEEVFACPNHVNFCQHVEEVFACPNHVNFCQQVEEVVTCPNHVNFCQQVEEVFTCPIRDLCDRSRAGSTQFRTGPGYTLPVYLGAPYRIWGLTAIVLHQTLTLIAPGLYTHKIRHVA